MTLYIASSLNPKAGLGLFAKESIAPNKFIAEITGPVLTLKEFMDLPDSVRAYGVLLSKNCILSGVEGDGRFANSPYRDPRRRKANVIFKKRKTAIVLQTIRRIHKNQEILVEYGDDYRFFA